MKINDFVTMVNLIDICTERGSFKGNELLAVGSLREKLAEFIKENAPATPDVQEEPTEELAEEDNEEEYTE